MKRTTKGKPRWSRAFQLFVKAPEPISYDAKFLNGRGATSDEIVTLHNTADVHAILEG
jgi:hypothetical protein